MKRLAPASRLFSQKPPPESGLSGFCDCDYRFPLTVAACFPAALREAKRNLNKFRKYLLINQVFYFVLMIKFCDLRMFDTELTAALYNRFHCVRLLHFDSGVIIHDASGECLQKQKEICFLT